MEAFVGVASTVLKTREYEYGGQESVGPQCDIVFLLIRLRNVNFMRNEDVKNFLLS